MSEEDVLVPEELVPKESSDSEIPADLAVLPVGNMVVYPFMIAPMIVADDKSKGLVEDALRGERCVRVGHDGFEAAAAAR